MRLLSSAMLGTFVALVVVALFVYLTGDALPAEYGFLIAIVTGVGSYAAGLQRDQPARSGGRRRRRRRSKRVNDGPPTLE